MKAFSEGGFSSTRGRKSGIDLLNYQGEFFVIPSVSLYSPFFVFSSNFFHAGLE